jgi:tetratricopeptide (TPR) repeat protein
LCRGHSLTALGRRDEALEAYDQALAIDPRDADAWRGKAQLEDDMKHWDEALRSYREYLELAPRPLGRNVGMVLIRIRELEVILSHGGDDITKW